MNNTHSVPFLSYFMTLSGTQTTHRVPNSMVYAIHVKLELRIWKEMFVA